MPDRTPIASLGIPVAVNLGGALDDQVDDGARLRGQRSVARREFDRAPRGHPFGHAVSASGWITRSLAETQYQAGFFLEDGPSPLSSNVEPSG